MRGQTTRRAFAVACCLLGCTIANNAARADGGRLVHAERVGDFMISIFVAPDPPHVGPIDVSVLLQRADDDAVIDDAQIAVSMQQVGESPLAVSGPATHEQATNKLLRSAWLKIPTAGEWKGVVHCSIADRSVTAPFTIEVSEALPAWTDLAPWFLWPILIVLLFGMHRFLRRRKNPRSDQRPPEDHLLHR